MKTATPLPLLPKSDCVLCKLHKTAKSVGIPMRPIVEAEHDVAVLFIGMSPGASEDRQGQAFVGPAGRLLHFGYCRPFSGIADIWVTNAVKCRPERDSKGREKRIPKSCITACADYLTDDLNFLLGKYKRVVAVCLGAIATDSVLGIPSVDKATRQPGAFITKVKRSTRALVSPVSVFATYHPAYLLRQGNRSLNQVVEDHLKLVAEFISAEKGTLPEESLDVDVVEPEEFLARIQHDPVHKNMLWFDIETYGIFKGHDQTQFTPGGAWAVDGVPKGRQIRSIAFSFRTGNSIVCSAFMVGGKEHVAKAILMAAMERGLLLSATNIIFDLSFISENFSLKIPKSVGLRDLLILAFLENPLRPEKSLKSLARLLIVNGGDWFRYAEGSVRQYSESEWEDMLQYNLRDVVIPPVVWDKLEARIRKSGLPPDLDKLLELYSRDLHTILHMTLAGVRINRAKLIHMCSAFRRRLERLIEAAERCEGIKVRGKGSMKSIQEVMTDAVRQRKMPPVGSWWLTDKGKISTSALNLQIIVKFPRLFARSTVRAAKAIMHARRLTKLLTTYCEPLLELTKREPFVYPQWYAVPSSYSMNSNDQEETGGTRQVRITCKKPALQTAPSIIKGLFTSRFNGNGALIWMDFSQLELRVMALVSGDNAMIRAFEEGRDLHHEVLVEFLGHDIAKDHPRYSELRRAAKFVNFGRIYRGGPNALQPALWKATGQYISYEELSNFCRAFDSKWKGVVRWCEERESDVRQTGVSIIPLTGHWLPFKKFEKGEEPDKAIFNHWIQGLAAQITKSVQYDIMLWLEQHKRGACCLNVYDAILLDVLRPAEEVAEELPKIVENNRFLADLRGYFGRHDFPFPVDIKVISC